MIEEKKILNDDKIIIAGAIGALSTVVSDIVTNILVSEGFGKYSVYKLVSFDVTITGKRPSELMGLIIYFITGSILGVLIYLILKRWGHRYAILICVLATTLMWFTYENIMTSTIEGKTVPLRPVSDYYVHLIGSICYGVTMGLMMKGFIFKKNYVRS